MSIQSNYTLLIQGPILSSGRTGITFFKELSQSSIVNYRCEENILALLKEYSSLFKNICIVTWNSEDLDESLFSEYANCKVLKLQDITPVTKIDNKKLPTDFNNKFKQFYALYKGSEIYLDSDAQFIIKVRTDQYVDLKRMIREHQASIDENEKNLSKIYIPYINQVNFLPSDFYFIAQKNIFNEFAGAMLWNNYLEFNSSVHIDMCLKYAYLYHRKYLQIPTRTYFLNSFEKNINRNKVILKNYLDEHVFKLLSSKLLENTRWRGDLIQLDEKNIKMLAFSDRNSNLYINPMHYKNLGLRELLYTNIPALITATFPILRNSWIELIMKKMYSTFVRMFKK